MDFKDFNILYEFLKPLIANFSAQNDTWSTAVIKGHKYDNFKLDISNLLNFLKSRNSEAFIKVKLDGQNVEESDIDDYIPTFATWEILLNKSRISYLSTGDFQNNFFLFQVSLIKWLSDIDPFDKENPFNKNIFNRIFVFDYKNGNLYSDNLQILNIQENFHSTVLKKFNIPGPDSIAENVRILSQKDITINPRSFLILNGDIGHAIAKAFNKQAIKLLSTALVNEIHSENKIVIDGYRKVTMELSSDKDSYCIELLLKLCESIEWIYNEKTTTRKKLIAERLSLDLNESQSLVKNLDIHLKNAFSQAQSRYNFIILERKDLYLKELKDLLKDLKSQSDLYSTKIRTLLSNLLRDSLAALLLVGFTIFTKFSDNIQLDKIKLLDFVFNSLAIYYTVSIVFQIVIDLIDIRVSKNELLYWKNSSRELLPEEEFKGHIKESLSGRRNSLYFIYPLIILSYLLIAFSCYKFPDYFKKMEQNSSEVNLIEGAKLYHFGVLMSTMQMTWVKHLCGRIKSDYCYSNELVYNNYPWPESPNEKQIKSIESAAQKVLDARTEFPNSSLADLYNPLTMPPALVKAHNELDKAVDLAYRPQPFISEAKRMEFLFELYEKYTADLFTTEKVKKTKKK